MKSAIGNPQLQQSAIIEWLDPTILKPHKFSQDIYGDDGYADLIPSIKELGVLQALYVNQNNLILSGHRRWRAALEAKVKIPVIRKIYSSKMDEHQAIIEFNRYRIKTGIQLYNEGKALENIEIEKAKRRQGKRTDLYPDIPQNFAECRDIVATTIGLGSGEQWRKLSYIGEHKPELLSEIKPQGISIHRAYKLTEREVISKSCIEPQVPEGLFSVIVVDPPWPYQTKAKDYDPDGRVIAPPYQDISIEEIKAIQLPMADDCIVWLWTTNAFMHDALHCLEAWGLEQKVILTWFKGRGPDNHIQRGVGHWLRGQTEHCLVAVRGKPKLYPYESAGTAFFAINRGHSVKPDEFYEMVSRICPGRKIDWFSRTPREGWETYGNQTR